MNEAEAARPPSAGLRGWILAAVAAVVLAATGLALAERVGGGTQPDFEAASEAKLEWPSDPGVLHLAGSGSNLPLTRALVEAWRETKPGFDVVLHESIGSGGGVRAARDGAVDLGLVSRPLKEHESGLSYVPYAHVGVVFAAHPSVPETNVDAAGVMALYGGATRTWSDGSRVVVLQREPGDSSSSVVANVVDGFGDVEDEARAQRRWRVLLHDDEMQQALVSTRGAIGLLEYGAVVTQDLPLHVLRFDDVVGSPANVQSGAYPLKKTLAFVHGGEPSEGAAAFMDFVRSEEGGRIIREGGYAPAKGGP